MVELKQSVIDEFRTALRGPLLLPGDAGFDQARSVWNGMIRRQPAMVVRCVGTTDIVAGIRFAREHGVVVSVKGGGHNISGLAVSDGALLLDLSLRRGVWVNPYERTAVAQTGCTLGDVDRETQLHGLPHASGLSPGPASQG